MFKKDNIEKLDDYFKKYSDRKSNSIYFYRIEKYNSNLDNFFYKYLKETQLYGAYFDKGILSPIKNQIDYFTDNIGENFELEINFISQNLRKWLPNINPDYYKVLEDSIFSFLLELSNIGKNHNILKNIYIKFMCWLYYRFDKILVENRTDNVPKILYLGNVNLHELEILDILSKIGCDILILTTEGVQEYKKADPDLKKSYIYDLESSVEYPKDFSLKTIINNGNKSTKENVKSEEKTDSTEEVSEEKTVITNEWLTGDIFQECIKLQKERGINNNYFYNVFSKVEGVENKEEYENSLVQWKMKIEALNRKFLVIEREIELPDMLEVKKINQGNFSSKKETIEDLCKNIKFQKSDKIEKIIKKSFVEILENSDLDNIQKIKNTGTIILCWLNRYLEELFNENDINKSSVVVFLGFSGNKNENNFIKFISKLPIDVFILNPDLNIKNTLEDKYLFTKTLPESKELEKFPTEIENIQVSTVAYSAERELDSLLYQGTGMYRRKQFRKAIPITLKTTFEEINILWKEESKVRSGFDILEDKVMVPTIFAKISGVSEANEANYWRTISNLVTKDTFLIKKVPFIKSEDYNPIREVAHNFIKNKKIEIDKIKNHSSYKYGHLQEDVQDFILYGIQKVIDSEVIKGNFTKGVEYTIISTILNMDKSITRLIQNYDFTKDIPKIMMFSLREEICSLEDSILIYFLNSIGFDILIFVPTGYQCLEKYYNKNIFLEHQVGEYLYNTLIPTSLYSENDRKKGGLLSWFKI